MPHGRWKTTTFSAGLRVDALAAPFTLDGWGCFRRLVQQVLASELAADDVVILDKLPAHKVRGVRQGIEPAVATLMYVPACSLAFNPIDHVLQVQRTPRRGRRPDLWEAHPHRGGQPNAKIISPPLDYDAI